MNRMNLVNFVDEYLLKLNGKLVNRCKYKLLGYSRYMQAILHFVGQLRAHQKTELSIEEQYQLAELILNQTNPPLTKIDGQFKAYLQDLLWQENTVILFEIYTKFRKLALFIPTIVTLLQQVEKPKLVADFILLLNEHHLLDALLDNQLFSPLIIDYLMGCHINEVKRCIPALIHLQKHNALNVNILTAIKHRLLGVDACKLAEAITIIQKLNLEEGFILEILAKSIKPLQTAVLINLLYPIPYEAKWTDLLRHTNPLLLNQPFDLLSKKEALNAQSAALLLKAEQPLMYAKIYLGLKECDIEFDDNLFKKTAAIAAIYSLIDNKALDKYTYKIIISKSEKDITQALPDIDSLGKNNQLSANSLLAVVNQSLSPARTKFEPTQMPLTFTFKKQPILLNKPRSSSSIEDVKQQGFR